MSIIEKGKQFLKYFATYLAIAGLVTFSMFIIEEAYQTVMFGTWPAQDADRWDLVLKGSDLMEDINKTLKIINYCAGWIQPLAFISYHAYSKSAEYYVEALRAKAFANAPELFIGRTVTVGFNPQRSERTEDGRRWRLVNGRIRVEVDQLPKEKIVTKTGKVTLEGDKIVIK
jgi:hypothetical protein